MISVGHLRVIDPLATPLLHVSSELAEAMGRIYDYVVDVGGWHHL